MMVRGYKQDNLVTGHDGHVDTINLIWPLLKTAIGERLCWFHFAISFVFKIITKQQGHCGAPPPFTAITEK